MAGEQSGDDAGVVLGDHHLVTPVPDYRLIVERIKEIRGTRSLSEFARNLGVNKENLRRVVAGQVPNATLLIKVCQAEDINANWLLLGVEPKHGSDQLAMLKASIDAEQVVSGLCELVAASCGLNGDAKLQMRKVQHRLGQATSLDPDGLLAGRPAYTSSTPQRATPRSPDTRFGALPKESPDRVLRPSALASRLR